MDVWYNTNSLYTGYRIEQILLPVMQNANGRYCHSVAVKNVRLDPTAGRHQQNFPDKEVALKCSANNAKIHADSVPDCMNQSNWTTKRKNEVLECFSILPEDVLIFKQLMNFFLHLQWWRKTIDLILLFGMRRTYRKIISCLWISSIWSNAEEMKR